MPTTPPSDPDQDRSAPSSTASPGAEPGDVGGLLLDGGPPFDPEAAGAAAAPVDPDALAASLRWSETRVRSLLQAQGSALHGLVAIEKGQSTEWLYTSADLGAIAPPLTRILNRYPATRAAAASGDELAVVVGFAGYGMRSWSERRRALVQLQLDGGEPDPYDEPAADASPVDVADAQDASAADAPRPLPPIRSPRRL